MYVQLNTLPVNAMKILGGMEVELHSFLTMALGGDEWSVSRHGHLTPWKWPPLAID
jgi:hypothetical protein